MINCARCCDAFISEVPQTNWAIGIAVVAARRLISAKYPFRSLFKIRTSKWNHSFCKGPAGVPLLWPRTLKFAALDGNTLTPGPEQPYLAHFLVVLVESFVPPTAVVQKLIYMHKTKGYCGRDFSSAAASAFRSTERAFHASACPSVCQAVSRWIRLGADSCWRLWCIVAPGEIDIDTCAEEKVVGLG